MIHCRLLPLLALIFFVATVSTAKSTTVTNTHDSGAGSLRDAIAITNTGGTVDFALKNCPCTIVLTSGVLVIDRALSVVGPGAAQLTISGNDGSSVFDARAAALVTIENIRVSHGNPSGILCHALILRNSVVSDNFRGIHGGSDCTIIDSTISHNVLPEIYDVGAGIAMVGGTLTIIRSTISENYAEGAGGGILLFVGATANITDSTIEGNCCDGMSVQLSTATVTNSTFSGNTTFTGAGVISNIAQLDLKGNKWPSTVTLINSTVTDTRSLGKIANEVGSVINLDDGVVPATFIMRNSIVAGGFPGIPDVYHYGKSGGIRSGGYNLIGNVGKLRVFNETGDQTGTPATPLDPRLEPLASNGGTTRTHELKLDSPAVDRGKAFGIAADQRGSVRPNDNPDLPNALEGDGSDIGAFEVQFPVAGAVAITGRVTYAGMIARSRGFVTLTDSSQNVRFAYINPSGYYRFTDVPRGRSFTVGLRAKRWEVEPQIIFIVESLTGFDLVAY